MTKSWQSYMHGNKIKVINSRPTILVLGSNSFFNQRAIELLRRAYNVICFELHFRRNSYGNKRLIPLCPLEITHIINVNKCSSLLLTNELFYHYNTDSSSKKLVNCIDKVLDLVPKLNFVYIRFQFVSFTESKKVEVKYIRANKSFDHFIQSSKSLHNIKHLNFDCYIPNDRDATLLKYNANTNLNNKKSTFYSFFLTDYVIKKAFPKIKITSDFLKKVSEPLLLSLHKTNNGTFKIKVDNKNVTNIQIIKICEAQANCSLRLLYRAKGYDHIQNSSIASVRYSMGAATLNLIPTKILDKIDLIVPVPETGNFYAQGLSWASKKPYVQAVYKLNPIERGFDIQDIRVRKGFLHNQIHCIKDLVHKKTVALVDEAVFTGATIKSVSTLLIEAGVNSLYVVVPSPQTKRHCHVNIQPERPVLANLRAKEALLHYLGVSDIFFQSESVYNSFVSSKGFLCTSCFSDR